MKNHDKNAEERSAEFKAAINEQRARLHQLGKQYDHLAKDASTKWKVFNDELDVSNQEVINEVDARIAAIPIPDGDGEIPDVTDPLRQQQSSDAPASSQTATAAQVLSQAAAGDPLAQKVLVMIEHKVEISPAELRDMATMKPNAEEEKLVARFWAWTDGLILEDNQAAYTCAQLDIQPDAV